MGGMGRWIGWDYRGFNFDAGLTILTGHLANHLELFLGGMLVFYHDYYRHNVADYRYELDEYALHPDDFERPPVKPHRKDFLSLKPLVTLDYRHQKPAGRRIFRLGAGFPTLIYFGYGVAF